jgi:hypothetical protein
MELYAPSSEFATYLTSAGTDDAALASFKSAPAVRTVLDGCSKSQGQAYLDRLCEEFPDVSYAALKAYVQRNDSLGDPNMCILLTAANEMLFCSPANMRYAYYACCVLRDCRARGCRTIVEVGGGYGGLFLAVDSLKAALETEITDYRIVEIPAMCPLARRCIEWHADKSTTAATVHESTTWGADVPDTDYLVSLFCLTEISDTDRRNYFATLAARTKHGFILWQTAFGANVAEAGTELNKPVSRVAPERPQSSGGAPNYVVVY